VNLDANQYARAARRNARRVAELDRTEQRARGALQARRARRAQIHARAEDVCNRISKLLSCPRCASTSYSPNAGCPACGHNHTSPRVEYRATERLVDTSTPPQYQGIPVEHAAVVGRVLGVR